MRDIIILPANMSRNPSHVLTSLERENESEIALGSNDSAFSLTIDKSMHASHSKLNVLTEISTS